MRHFGQIEIQNREFAQGTTFAYEVGMKNLAVLASIVVFAGVAVACSSSANDEDTAGANSAMTADDFVASAVEASPMRSLTNDFVARSDGSGTLTSRLSGTSMECHAEGGWLGGLATNPQYVCAASGYVLKLRSGSVFSLTDGSVHGGLYARDEYERRADYARPCVPPPSSETEGQERELCSTACCGVTTCPQSCESTCVAKCVSSCNAGTFDSFASDPDGMWKGQIACGRAY